MTSSKPEKPGGVDTLLARERVLKALHHEEPDRVPFDCTMTIGACANLRKHFGLPSVPIEFDVPYLGAFADEELGDALQLDLAYVGVGWPLRDHRPVFDGNAFAERFVDGWGLLWKMVSRDSGFYYEVANAPLSDATIEDLQEFPWPNPHDQRMYEGLVERVERLQRVCDRAIVGKFGAGFFALALHMRGTEQLYLDFALNPEFAKALLWKTLEFYLETYKQAIALVGDKLDIIRVDNDDLGSQMGPLISLDMYRDILKPIHRRFYTKIKEWGQAKNPQVQLMKHSCGSVMAFVEDFIDAGVDILNPLQPGASQMDLGRLKSRYGDRLCFHGGVDTQEVLPYGSIADIHEEVAKRIGLLAPGGGYILAPGHHIQDDVPVERILALRDALLKYGTYPLALP